MKDATGTSLRSLDVQRDEFAAHRFVAMPLAGLIAWTVVGIAGMLLPPLPLVLVTFCATGSTAYLGMFISRFTGENFMGRNRPRNVFDSLFLHAMAQALLVFSIAIPFFMLDYTSLPLSLGILTGLMWVPLSWIIGHWVGWFHAIVRTLVITACWYIFPAARFVIIPAVIVVLYAVTILILEQRWRQLNRNQANVAG